MLKFEWHDTKAEANLHIHGVSFDMATTVFKDPFGMEWLDDREDYGEERFILIGMAKDLSLLYVAHTEREDRIRIISARKRHHRNMPTNMPDASKQIASEALVDPDARPLTPADFQRMKRTPQTKIIRRALELTQEEFSLRYHIPLGTLRDWEQGRAEPDQPTRAYITLIARDPEYVHRTLNRQAS